MTLKIRSGSTGNKSENMPLRSESEYLGVFRNLMEYFLSVSETGVLTREPGSLQIFIEAGKWKARLKDREERVYCFVAAETLDDLLLAVDEGLGSGNLDWRPDQPGSFSKPRK